MCVQAIGNKMTADPFCDRELFGMTIFYESEHFMMLYDIRPVVRGHCLIVPKRHTLDLLELSDKEAAEMHKVLSRIVPRLLEIYGASEGSYDITSQVGKYSGRSVAHLHFHIIPRNRNDAYQRDDMNIFEDIKLNKTIFTVDDVKKEVSRLRKEFGYSQRQI